MFHDLFGDEISPPHKVLGSGFLYAYGFAFPKIFQQFGLVQPLLRFDTNDPSERFVRGGGSNGKENA